MIFLGTPKSSPLGGMISSGATKMDIGPEFQNHTKSLQIQPSFRDVLGSPFVHLTKFHRCSASFFGAHLFSIAIGPICTRFPANWATCSQHTNICQDLPKLGCPKMEFGLFWVVMAQLGLKTAASGPKSRSGPVFQKSGPDFGPVFAPGARHRDAKRATVAETSMMATLNLPVSS